MQFFLVIDPNNVITKVFATYKEALAEAQALYDAWGGVDEIEVAEWTVTPDAAFGLIEAKDLVENKNPPRRLAKDIFAVAYVGACGVVSL